MEDRLQPVGEDANKQVRVIILLIGSSIADTHLLITKKPIYNTPLELQKG
jgi:hypothetical protein